MEKKVVMNKTNRRNTKLHNKKQNKVDNMILKVTTKRKWKWAEHVALINDNILTVRCTLWQVRHGKRSRSRPRRRWRDDIQHW